MASENSTPASSDAPNHSKAQPVLSAQAAGDLARILTIVSELQEQHDARDKAFDLLYEQLRDYKNDFFYERLKPIIRALLFLLDSLESFGGEIVDAQKRQEIVPHDVINTNIDHFCDQLIDALEMVELSPIEILDENFDPKTQRAVQVVPVATAQKGQVQRVIRRGWTMGGVMLRPADVVVGKTSEGQAEKTKPSTGN